MTMLETLARRGHRMALLALDAFNPDQPRDERGRWGEGGPGSGAETASEHAASAKYHHDEEKVYGDVGHKEAAAAHAIAGKFHETAARFSNTTERGTRSVAAQSASQQANAASKKIRDQAVSGMVSPRESERMARDLRRTQTELPVHRDAPVALTAPHSQLPVGNTKPKEAIFVDLRQTQKLPAVSTPVKGSFQQNALSPANQRAVESLNRATKVQELEGAAARHEFMGRPQEAATARAEAQSLRTNPKEARRDAAAASAGRWASRALENAAKKPSPQAVSAASRAAFKATSSAKTPAEHRAAIALHEKAKAAYPIGQQSQRHFLAIKEHENALRGSGAEVSAAGHLPTRLR